MSLIKLYFSKFLANPLISGSLVMLIGVNIHNIGQLLYHYLAINLLSKAQYGDLAALVSIFGLIAIIQQSLALAVVKFIASSKSDDEANIYSGWFFKWGIIFGGLVSILILISASFLSEFLHISQKFAIYLFAPTIAVAFISNTGRAILQGFVKFIQLSGSMVVEVVIKILVTVTLLYLGYEILGAVIGLLIGVVAGFSIVYFSIRNRIANTGKATINLKPILKYSFPVLAQSLAITSMISTDLLLVKHFFQPDIAGAYAALAKFGTISFFASSPITQVMFPIIARKHSHGEPYHRVLYLSLFIILSISIFVVICYYYFGTQIVGFLTSSKYLQESFLLWRLGFYMLLLGIAMLLSQFYLSIGKTKAVWFFILAAIFQIVLISLFHTSLIMVVNSSTLSAALLVVCLSIYFPYHNRKN